MVVSGKWIGLYTGKIFDQASDIDIDHIIPLREAHISGALVWSSVILKNSLIKTNFRRIVKILIW